MPRAYCNYVSIFPRGDSVSISLILHICHLLKAHSVLIKSQCLLKVRSSICNCSANDIYLPTDLDGLRIPQLLEVFAFDQSLALRPSHQIKPDDVVLVQQVKPSWIARLEHDLLGASWYLSVVEETR